MDFYTEVLSEATAAGATEATAVADIAQDIHSRITEELKTSLAQILTSVSDLKGGKISAAEFYERMEAPLSSSRRYRSELEANAILRFSGTVFVKNKVDIIDFAKIQADKILKTPRAAR